MRSSVLSAALVATFFATSALADVARYEAVWHSGDGASLTSAPLSRSAFLDSGNALAQNGMRLIDVETRIMNGRRVYAGLWTQGAGSNIFVGPMGPIDIREEMTSRRAQGLRVDDFEIFRTSSGGRRYIGIWRPGTGRELLTGPVEFDAFVARGERLTQDGMRLIDVEVERVDGRTLYSGLFRTGTGSNFITGPLRRRAFTDLRDQQVADGLQLVDVEGIQIGGTPRFVGVWSSGNGESRLSRLRSFGNFFAFAQNQFNDGKHAVDFEMSVTVSEQGEGGTDGSGSVPPSPIPELPPLPSHMDLVGGTIFRIDWSQTIEGMPRIEIPVDYLPDYLPVVDGEPALPAGSACGFRFVRADRAFWQVPGDDEFDDPPFDAVPDVSQDTNDFLGGIDLWGPILGCEGSQQQWNFPSPLTTSGPFNPQNVENLSLVIQMDPPSNSLSAPRIEFIPATEDADPIDVMELWGDEWMEDLLSWVEELNELQAQLSGEYCSVSSLMVEICTENPGLCPVPDPQGDC